MEDNRIQKMIDAWVEEHDDEEKKLAEEAFEMLKTPTEDNQE